ncbi:Zeatin O-glucosyltransferase [Forsythia ovata]|uniref:Glycosyltransferase n=1 Tax=Forsythia ovata TaxID=205694 RepID=A0ABD1SMQ1_9LAMI
MEQSQVAVIMVPLPCQSHLNQLLQLSGLISLRGIPVHYIGSATHNRQAKLRADGLNTNSMAKIYFHDLPTPPIADIDPNPNTLDKTPVHLWPATVAYMNFRQPIGTLLKDLSSKASRIVIVYDRLIAEAVQDALLIPNAESYAFNCLSAFNLFLILWDITGKPFRVGKELEDLPSAKELFPEGILHFIASKTEYFKDRAGDIDNTIGLIESTYIDLLAREEIRGNKKQWAIRPSFPVKPISTNDSKSKHKCLEWLDKQAPKSVIFVSFGTTTSLSDEEARDIAMGLEQSEQKFIWVLRDADKADIFAGETRRIELPGGFEERMEGVGIVVRDWAPQLEILAHKSTGGFMSHCGWNSCLESISMGVPIAAWPMHSDQPLNAIFLTEILKVGVAVREWTQKEEAVKASRIKNVVERLMASEEGDKVRKRAEELGAIVRQSMEEGGDSYKEFNSFIAHITR